MTDTIGYRAWTDDGTVVVTGTFDLTVPERDADGIVWHEDRVRPDETAALSASPYLPSGACATYLIFLPAFSPAARAFGLEALRAMCLKASWEDAENPLGPPTISIGVAGDG